MTFHVPESIDSFLHSIILYAYQLRQIITVTNYPESTQKIHRTRLKSELCLSRQYTILLRLIKMHGKHHDIRVYQHFQHTHSRVPYLDHQIFNISTAALRDSRNANRRVQAAQTGLERTKEKSELLENTIKSARSKKQEEAKDFMTQLQKSQEACLEKERLSWSSFQKEQDERAAGYVKDQLYLESLLKTNTSKAEGRLSAVRRW